MIRAMSNVAVARTTDDPLAPPPRRHLLRRLPSAWDFDEFSGGTDGADVVNAGALGILVATRIPYPPGRLKTSNIVGPTQDRTMLVLA